jgi:hypothetical protein
MEPGDTLSQCLSGRQPQEAAKERGKSLTLDMHPWRSLGCKEDMAVEGLLFDSPTCCIEEQVPLSVYYCGS